jgi:hypothetical protein
VIPPGPSLVPAYLEPVLCTQARTEGEPCGQT